MATRASSPLQDYCDGWMPVPCVAACHNYKCGILPMNVTVATLNTCAPGQGVPCTCSCSQSPSARDRMWKPKVTVLFCGAWSSDDVCHCRLRWVPSAMTNDTKTLWHSQKRLAALLVSGPSARPQYLLCSQDGLRGLLCDLDRSRTALNAAKKNNMWH
jgi:hypothetical protein